MRAPHLQIQFNYLVLLLSPLKNCSKSKQQESGLRYCKDMGTDPAFAFSLFAACLTWSFAAAIPQTLPGQVTALLSGSSKPYVEGPPSGGSRVTFQLLETKWSFIGTGTAMGATAAEKRYELALCYEVLSHERSSAEQSSGGEYRGF